MQKTLRIVALPALLALTAFACTAGGGELQIAHVHGLAITAKALFVATHHGLYVRAGGEWSQRSEDRADHMGFSYVSDSLMFRSGHPEAGGNLGVQRSTDGGKSWEKMSNVLESPVDFHAMAASRDKSPVLYGWSQGLFRSVDDPQRWEPVQTFGLPPAVGALTVGGDGTVYASTNAGLNRSTNRGERWDRTGEQVFFALAAAGRSDVLYASLGPSVQRSTDGGENWKDASDGLGTKGTIVALAASNDGELVVAADETAAIWQSDDGGESWSQVPTP